MLFEGVEVAHAVEPGDAVGSDAHLDGVSLEITHLVALGKEDESLVVAAHHRPSEAALLLDVGAVYEDVGVAEHLIPERVVGSQQLVVGVACKDDG